MRKAKSAFMVGLGVFLMGLLGGTAIAADGTTLVLSATGRQQVRVQCDEPDQVVKIQTDSGVPNPAISGLSRFKFMCVGGELNEVKTLVFEAVGGVFQLEDGGEGRTFIEVVYLKDPPKSMVSAHRTRKPKK